MSTHAFERYRAIVPEGEWGEFVGAMARLEPRSFRVRRGRTEPGLLIEALERQGFRMSPASGIPDVFRVDHEPFPLSETLEHWLGLLYIQQVATCLAAPALDPRPGERILDLCAAPGGKTSHLAERMEDEGCLVAVDLSEPRIQALVGNLSRMAHSSVITVAGDALRIPETACFDRALVDVPCSGEGRSRRDRPHEASEGDLRRLPRLQEALLRKALRLVRPGGRVLYVTCTLAPEENEGVVDAVLRDLGDGAGASPEARLIPLRPDVPHAPGVASFDGVRYAPELEGACRIHPHHLDSGGLFLALLERVAEGTPDGDARGTEGPKGFPNGWSRPGHRLPGEFGDPEESATLDAALDAALDRITASTGMERSELERYSWCLRKDAWRFHQMPAWPLESWAGAPGRLRVVTAGLRGIELDARGRVRASGDLLRALGSRRSPHGLELDEEAWIRLLTGASVPGRPGNQLLLHRGQPLAVGRSRGTRLMHDLPPGKANWLRQVMERRREAIPGEASG
jgi:16S rRNA C967 or C1407 C5-methylase (RsmB/RsmF family)